MLEASTGEWSNFRATLLERGWWVDWHLRAGWWVDHVLRMGWRVIDQQERRSREHEQLPLEKLFELLLLLQYQQD